MVVGVYSRLVNNRMIVRIMTQFPDTIILAILKSNFLAILR